MRALLSKASGGPETLVFEEIAAPAPTAQQVLIEVKAVGVNYPDTLIIEDRYQFRPQRPFAPGAEVSGIVAKVGSGVSGLSVGDPVIAVCGWGGMAELVIANAAKCVPIPADMPFSTAAALIFTYGTAHYALLHRARLRGGETLLVLGAAGGVGLAAVELGKMLGARVIAAASTPDKAALARSRGADEAVVYPRAPLDPIAKKSLAQSFKAACAGNANVVIDCVGGDYAEPAVRALDWEGRYLIVGFTAGVPRIPLNLPLLKGCSLVGVFWGAWAERDPEAFQAASRELVDWCHAGRIAPFISQTLPLSAGAQGIRALAERSATGKIVLTN